MAVSPKEKLYPDNTIPYKDGFLKVAHEQFSEGISQILLCTAEGVLDSHVTYLVHLLDVSLVNGFQSDDCSSMLEALRRAPPGLVRILDYEVADHCIIAIQEWQDGDSFCQSPEQLLGVDEVNVHEIAQSLEWFHRIHPAAMHGRVSPGHCLIRDGRLKLHSPMYSVLLLKEMCSDAVMGTLKISELPPELLLSNRELKRCPIDGYGLGLLLYATLTGQILIEEGSPQETMGRVLGCPPRWPPDDTIRKSMIPIVERCVRKSPDKRYQTMQGLVSDLKTSLQKQSPFALGLYDDFRELLHTCDLVGREDETYSFASALTLASHGTPTCHLLAAPSGRGKTRLAEEWVRKGKESGFAVFQARCGRFERNIPLAAISKILDQQLLILEVNPSAAMQWQREMESRLGDDCFMIAQRFPQYKKYLEGASVRDFESTEEEEQAFIEVMSGLLTTLLPDKPLFLFVDDLQWVDLLSLKVLSNLCHRASKTRESWMFLGAFRSEEVSSDHLLTKFLVSIVEAKYLYQLPPFNENETENFIHALLDVDDTPAVMNDYVFQLSEGNPFHIQEILADLISHNAYKLSNGEWVFDFHVAETTPSNEGVFKILSGKINTLDPLIQKFLGRLAVFGRSIPMSYARLALSSSTPEISEFPESHIGRNERFTSRSIPEKLNSFLCSLRENRILFVENEQIVFIHDRLREASQAFLDNNERVEFSCRIVEAFSEMHGYQYHHVDSSVLFEMSHHAMRVGQKEMHAYLCDLLVESGRRASLLFSYGQAVSYFEKALQAWGAIKPNGEHYLELDEPGFDVWESYADALALTERIPEALNIYQHFASKQKCQEKRGNLYAKMCSNNLYLFRYVDSIRSGVKGLKELDESFFERQQTAILCLPFLFIWMLWRLFARKYLLKGNSPRTMTSQEESRYGLRSALIVPNYFVAPIPALANMMVTTARLAPYGSHKYWAYTMNYWGVVCAALGLYRVSEYCFQRAQSWLMTNADVPLEIFHKFVQGYLLEFPRGNLQKSRQLQLQALELATKTGETFWRFLAFQGLIHVDQFGGDTGEGLFMSSRLEEFHRKIGFEPTILGCIFKTLWLEGREKDLKYWIDRVDTVGRELTQAGFETIDVVYSSLAPGEILLMKGQAEEANLHLRRAFFRTLRRCHRVAYCTLAPILYAQSLIRSKKKHMAILPLTMAWLNRLLGVRVFLPQTLQVTGELFCSYGFERIGIEFMRRGIEDANSMGAESVAIQIRHAQALQSRDLGESDVLLEGILAYYKRRRWLPLIDMVEEQILHNKRRIKRKFPLLMREEQNERASHQQQNLNQKIGVLGVFDILSQLSITSDRGEIAKSILQINMAFVGADHGVLFGLEEHAVVPWSSIGVSEERISRGDYLGANIDMETVYQLVEDDGSQGPKKLSRESTAVICIPIRVQGQVVAILYLGNKLISTVFDDLDFKGLRPILAQAGQILHSIEVIQLRARQERHQADLRLANKIQNTLLFETDLPETISIKTFYEPASKVGGDWCGYAHDPQDDVTFVFMGDVTGHGVAPALIMATVAGALSANESIVNAALSQSKSQSIGERVLDLSRAASSAIYRFGSPIKIGMTLMIGALCGRTGKFTWTSAGHPPPILVGKDGVRVLPCPGPLLGLVTNPEFTLSEVEIEPQETLILYTDGLKENSGPDGSMLTDRKIEAGFKIYDEESDVLNRILKIGREIWKDSAPEDDLAIMTINLINRSLK